MGPMRVFGEKETELDIKINFIASSLKPIKSSQQVMVTPHYTLDSAPKMDLFFLPGGNGAVWKCAETPPDALHCANTHSGRLEFFDLVLKSLRHKACHREVGCHATA